MTATRPPLILQRLNGFGPVERLTHARDGGLLPQIPLMYPATERSGYVVTGYDDAREVLANSTDFHVAADDYGDVSADEVAAMRAGDLLAMNPPEHTRLRRMLVPAFTARRMAALQPRIAEIVETCLDDLEAQPRPADLVAHFALPVPSLVICELLGVPYRDRAEFQARADVMLDATVSAQDQLRNDRDQRRYMTTLVNAAQADPGHDLLGMLVRDHGCDLTTDELVGICNLLLVAGHETTANMLGLGTLALLRHPDQLAALRTNPDLAGAAVEELMRWCTVVPAGMDRITTRDVVVGEHTIPAGEYVTIYLPTANRDPAFIDDPERLDIARGATGHVGFGHGVHHCLGASLARLEMRIAFPALLQRFPHLALAIDLDAVTFRTHHLVYGVHALTVTW